MHCSHLPRPHGAYFPVKPLMGFGLGFSLWWHRTSQTFRRQKTSCLSKTIHNPGFMPQMCGNTDELADMKFGTPRNLHNSMQLLEGTKNVHEKGKILAQCSVLPFSPILHTFPHIRLHSSVDIYRIFRCKPMHVLSLGISPLLNKCLCTMLKDKNWVTNAMVKVSDSFK